MKPTFAPVVEAAIAQAVPELLKLIGQSPSETVADVLETWARKLIAVATPPVHVDASATGAPIGIIGE